MEDVEALHKAKKIQNGQMKELIDSHKELIELTKQNNAVLRELLNFFVSIDRREQGNDSENQEYLKELEQDGFRPPVG